jgi:hypothetical protein
LYHDTDDSVAEAVKSTHPDEALAIWKQVAEWEIARVKPAAYKVAAPYLRKIRALYRKQKRTDEWNTYLTALRRQHKAKRRLIEITGLLMNPTSRNQPDVLYPATLRLNLSDTDFLKPCQLLDYGSRINREAMQ